MTGAGVTMENGVKDNLPTNHDRDHAPYPSGGSGPASQAASDRQNGAITKSTRGDPGSTDTMMMNGDANGGEGAHGGSRMNDLPDEIQHITQGFVPLSLLLSRLAQQTHNQLGDEIMALAKMPISQPAVNGNSAYADATTDDNSPENLAKKVRLLNFVQERHGEWVKALVITNWSRKAKPVSALIDIMNFTNMQRRAYDVSLDHMINVKRDLTFARVPNPDLQTALQTLSTGSAPWMPEFNYVPPAPLTAQEILRSIENINTMLSIRLNLEDYENVPFQFQNYSIESGRVTFKVPGEFEVDLTIADEVDFEKQFWFIDFRFAFEPAPLELSDNVRIFLERKVNESLEREGLPGCYKFLHEFVLTHKITEYVRQAFDLSKGRWVDTLKVERLNRAMSIQYWTNRFAADGPKSWIILGVHSGKKQGAAADARSSSYLTLRWFKDNKEVKDADIQFDTANVSTEELLNRVIAKHIEHILTTIHGKLQSNGRFSRRGATLDLDISNDKPADSSLQMQLGHNYFLKLKVAPITGMFSMSPQSPVIYKGEGRLNWSSKDPVQDGPSCLEAIRCHYTVDELNRRGKSVGWGLSKGPAKPDDVKAFLKVRDLGQLIWLQRQGWTPQWFLMLSLSLGGDRWWLVETNGQRLSTYTRLELGSTAPDLSDGFFSSLSVFTAGIISQMSDLRKLHQENIENAARVGQNCSLPASMKIPTIFVRLSSILSRKGSHKATRKPPSLSWAHDFVQIVFIGISRHSSRLQQSESVSGSNDGANRATATEWNGTSLRTVVDARIKVADPARFSLLKGHVDRDVAYNSRHGVFALRLEASIGTSILDTLTYRLQALERLANCVDAIQRCERDVACEEIMLDKITITFSDQPKRSEQERQRFKALLDLGADNVTLSFEKGNPHLRSLDVFQNLLNSELSFTKLPYYLSSVLPLQRALDGVEDAWATIAMNNQGRVEIFAAHLDWFNIRYTLPGVNKNTPRRLTLQIRLRDRKSSIMWHVYREQPRLKEQPEDEFKSALQRVWTADNRAWVWLDQHAAVDPDHRVAELVQAIDDAVRALLTQSPAVTKQNQVTSKATPQSKNAGNVKPPASTGANKGQARPTQQQKPPHNTVVILDD